MYHRLDLFVQENVDRIKLLSTILMISCLVSSIALFYLAIKSSVSLYFVYSALFILIILFYYKKNRSIFKRGNYWADLITEESNEIVWIKPIKVKHKSIIITIYETRHFQLLTKNGLKVNIDCSTDERREIFLEGIKTYLPHAHIGYSYQVDHIYKKDSQNFIQNLRLQNLYMPVCH